MSTKKNNSNLSPLLIQSESLEAVPYSDTEAGLRVGIPTMENGWIKLHRKSLDHWLYNEKRPLTKREAWENMLLMANHSPKKVLIKGELITCDRGQSVMSLQSWAKEFLWTRQMVRTFFDLLKKDEMINTEGLHNSTRVTICNYETYQSNQHADNTPNDSKQHADNTPTTTNKNDKNKENIKEKEINKEKEGQSTEPTETPIAESTMADLAPMKALKEQYATLKNTPRGAALFFAKYMFDILLKKYPDHKTILTATTNRWVTDSDMLLRVDKIDIKKAVAVFEYAMADAFWTSIVRSPANLRKNFDTIRAKMDNPMPKNNNTPEPPATFTGFKNLITPEKIEEQRIANLKQWEKENVK